MLTLIGVGFYSDIACWVFGDTLMNVDEVKSTFFLYCIHINNNNINIKNHLNMKTKNLISFLAGMLISIAALAQTFTANTVEGVEVTYMVTSSTDKTVQVGNESVAIDETTEGSITIPATVTFNGEVYHVTAIGYYAFNGCSKITSISGLSSCTSIRSYAFIGCSSLTSVDLSSCTSIGNSAFYGCSSLTSVGELSSCASIGNHAFYECYNLTSITLPSKELVTLGDNYAIPKNMSVLVPGNLMESYKNATNWSDINSQLIPIGSQTVWNVDLTQTPSATSSALMTAIGSTNLANVIDMKITGDINGYDIFIMRNQMPNLHKLDMTNANIKASGDNYCYYDTYYTTDNVLGDYAFYQQAKLVDVKLPRTITSIGSNAFSQSGLLQITIPEGIVSIGGDAFCGTGLTSVVLPSTLNVIGYGAFSYSKIKNLTLPSALKTIGGTAFYWCSSLSELTLPAGLQVIQNYAFGNCGNIRVVKATAIDPNSVTLADNAFDPNVYANATLYIPYDEETGWNATYNAYFWHTQWGQFTNKAVWKPIYDYVTIGGDYEQGTGTIPGDNIDADMGNESGYIVGENGEQEFDDVNIDDNGTSGGSIIADGDVSVNTLYCNISITANKWYFFCFPFDLHLKDNIRYDGSYVWHKYDGEARANNGHGGWKKMGSNAVLKAGQGYIFQGNKTGTLTIVVENPDLKRKDKNKDLDTYTADNAQDASWNLVGNPYLSYYDMDEIGFDAPITIWNGTNYDAVRPGDDDYHFQPYQAFFVQKPSGTTSLTFDGNGQETYHQSQAAASNVRERRAAAKHSDRRIVNLTVSDGEVTDKTRVVLNESKSRAYEMECDASKFFSEENVPQIYTIDGDVNYAINERPIEAGTVTLGFKANKEGEFTISAPRMDADCLLKDNETGLVFNLQNGSYTFSSKAGTFGQRFTLIFTEEATAIKKVDAELDGKNEALFDLSGRKAQEGQSGIVIKDGQKIIMK